MSRVRVCTFSVSIDGFGAGPDESWKGWWGEEPPYHVPVFVLTHHARRPIKMIGGTEFIFVTEDIDAALARAREAARGRDVRIGGVSMTDMSRMTRRSG